MGDERAVPLPAGEQARLDAVQALGILDAPQQPEFDALVRAAALVCDVPIALLTLVDEKRQFVIGNVGLPGTTQVARGISLCAHTILQDELLEIPDASRDARFAANPMVVGAPGIRFYAGVSVVLEGSAAVGALCVIDRKPRRLDERQREALHCLALSAAHGLESWRARRALAGAAETIRRLYEATPALLLSIASDGRVLTVSDAWLQRLGYHRAQVIGRRMQDFMTPSSQMLMTGTMLPRLLAEGCVGNVLLQLAAGSGELVDVLLSAVLQRGADGAPLHSLSVMEDVTRRLAIERALATERQRLSSLVESTRVGTLEWDMSSGVAVANERWAQILGYTVAELGPVTARGRAALIHPDDLLHYETCVARLRAGAVDHFEIDMRMRHRDGSWIWTLCRDSLVSPGELGHSARAFATMENISERKRREEAWRKSEEFLERAGQVAGVGAWELDVASGELTWSRETYRIHGVEEGFRPTLQSAIAFYALDAQEVIRDAVERAMAGGGGWDLELPMIRADGRPIWARAVGSTTLVGGKPIRVTGAFQDITERKAERMALHSAHERLTLAADSGGIGIWDWDLTQGAASWDAWMYRLFGLQPSAEPAGYELWARHLHPADRDAAERALQAAIDGAAPFDTDFRIIRADGAVRHIRTSAGVTRDADGRALRMVGANWDVTDQRRLAADLAEKHEQLRVTLQSIGDGVITTDAKGDVVWLNPVAERMTGWTTSDAAGRPAEEVFTIVQQDSRGRLALPIAGCLAQGTIGALPERTLLLSRSGAEFAIEDSAAPIRAAGGAVLGVVLVFHDVTEQRRLEDERVARERALQAANADLERLANKLAQSRDDAERANRAKSQFLAAMSHELRTPLNGVLGYAQLLRAEGGLNAVQTARVDAMAAAGTHLLGMINSVLDLTEIEQERIALHPVEIDAHALCAECLDMMGAAAQTKGLELRLARMPATQARFAACLVADPTRLRQILLNLLGNAVKFTASGGIVLRLRESPTNQAIRFEVADSGPGIAPDRRARLFRDFDRLDIEATRTVEGAGLGLALSSRFAVLMGGRLDHADNPGGGSVFTLELPLARTAAASPHGRAAPAHRTSRALRVLVVDDVAVNRDVARSFLAMAGHEVVCAADGIEAVSLAVAQDFDAVLMDVRMPGMDGLEATRRIRACGGERARVPVIGLTAQAFTEQVAACREAGMDGHLGKPYDIEALHAAVAQAASKSWREGGRDLGRDLGRKAGRPDAAATDGCDLPLLVHEVMDELCDYLPPDAIETHVRAVGELGRDLLGRLRREGLLAGEPARGEAGLSGPVHRLAGSAGMLGFERLAKVGLRFERAVGSGDAGAPALAGSLDAAIKATLEVIATGGWRRSVKARAVGEADATVR